jgi:hypothetical protein
MLLSESRKGNRIALSESVVTSPPDINQALVASVAASAIDAQAHQAREDAYFDQSLKAGDPIPSKLHDKLGKAIADAQKPEPEYTGDLVISGEKLDAMTALRNKLIGPYAEIVLTLTSRAIAQGKIGAADVESAAAAFQVECEQIGYIVETK